MAIKNNKVSPVKSKPAKSKEIKDRVKPKANSSVKAETIRINANLEKTLHEKVKKFATKNQLSLSQLISQAIKEYIIKTN